MDIANEDLDCLTTAVINIDYDYKILSVNSATESLFGLSKTNLYGVKLENLVADKDIFSMICFIGIENENGFSRHCFIGSENENGFSR